MATSGLLLWIAVLQVRCRRTGVLQWEPTQKWIIRYCFHPYTEMFTKHYLVKLLKFWSEYEQQWNLLLNPKIYLSSKPFFSACIHTSNWSAMTHVVLFPLVILFHFISILFIGIGITSNIFYIFLWCSDCCYCHTTSNKVNTQRNMPSYTIAKFPWKCFFRACWHFFDWQHCSDVSKHKLTKQKKKNQNWDFHLCMPDVLPPFLL